MKKPAFSQGRFMFGAATAAMFCLSLIGCGAVSTTAPLDVTETQPGVAIQGSVHGGQQPIVGAHVYLMAASTAGFGGAATSLLYKGDGNDANGYYVLTGTGGSFHLSGNYTCTPGTQVYLVATGGNPGIVSTATINNTAIKIVAVFGTCPSGSTFAGVIPYVVVDEVSTVAAAYTLASFATDYTHIGAPNTTQAQLGLANAFSGAGNLVALGFGQAYTTTPTVSGYGSGLSANGTVPQSKINTLADIIAACVNTVSSSSSQCSTLFTDATVGSNTPTDVFGAMLNLAHAPSTSIGTNGVYSLQASTAPFQPSLTAAPLDWTLSVQYAAPNTAAPVRPAVDTSGNIWIPNSGNNSLTELSPLGVVLSGTTGYTGGGLNEPDSVEIDPSGNVWASNLNSATVSEFSPSGSAVSTSGYTSKNIDGSYDIAIQGSDIVIPGYQSVTTLSSAGALVGAETATTVNSAVTVDPNGVPWTTQFQNNTIGQLTSTTAITTYGGAGISTPASIASDLFGNLWVANSGANSISELSNSGTAISSGSGFTGGGLLKPYGISVDRLGKVFVSNSNGSISTFNSTGTATSVSTGYTTPSTARYNANPNSTTYGFLPTYGMYGPAIDQAGNVWAPDLDGSLYEFVGIAAANVPATPVVQANSGGSTTGTYTVDTSATNLTLTGITTTYNVSNPIDVSKVSNPAPQGVYQSERVGHTALTYKETGLTPGATYTVRLHFAEIYWGNAGARKFNVAINGTSVLSNFDVFAAAGGEYIAIVRNFQAVADANGAISVAFTPGSNDLPKCDGIEFLQ